MNALLAYNYAKGDWQLWDVDFVGVFGKRHQVAAGMLTEEGRYRYPSIVSVEIAALTCVNNEYRIEIPADFEFPSVLTLEQSIQTNKKLLENS